jgi:uncharacterized membrane protein YeaQ/YmgE (transglycosylase-associated protein family)
VDVDGILSGILAGLIIGMLGRLIAPGRHRRIGLVLTVLVGIAGALIGAAVARAVDVEGFLLTFVMQLVAAALLVTLFRSGARH